MTSPQRAAPRSATLRSWVCAGMLVFGALAGVVRAGEEKVLKGEDENMLPYTMGQRIPLECLNRTSDTGEHITDSAGELQYIPFPTCNETNRPLELVFGSEADINCTIPTLTDELFHLFEFYIHNDAPLTCRLPSFPRTSATSAGLAPQDYAHFQIALTGTLQLSHLHINPNLNVIVHTASTSPSISASRGGGGGSSRRGASLARSLAALPEEGHILAATAYSLPPTSASPKLVMGDALALQLAVRWYSQRVLPPSTSRFGAAAAGGLGGHVHFSTVVYCLLSFGGGIAVSLAYFRGVELPKRMRRYGSERLGIMGAEGFGARGGYAFPGKRD